MPGIRTNDNLSLASSGGGVVYIEKIAEVILASAALSIDFTGIPQNYTHLQLCFSGTLSSTGTASIQLQFNGDTSSTSYSHVSMLSANIPTVATSENAGESSIVVGTISPTGVIPTSLLITIFDYARTNWNKNIVDECSHLNSIYRISTLTGTWRNTSAISSIKVSISSTNLSSGTIATLYGIK